MFLFIFVLPVQHCGLSFLLKEYLWFWMNEYVSRNSYISSVIRISQRALWLILRRGSSKWKLWLSKGVNMFMERFISEQLKVTSDCGHWEYFTCKQTQKQQHTYQWPRYSRSFGQTAMTKKTSESVFRNSFITQQYVTFGFL